MTRDDLRPALQTAFNMFNYTHGKPAEYRLKLFLASLAASGYAIVPVEATDEMLEALVKNGLEVCGYTRSLEIGDMQAGYRAMVAAAQKEQG